MDHKENTNKTKSANNVVDPINTILNKQDKKCAGQRLGIMLKVLPFALTTIFKCAPILSIVLALIIILSGLMPTATVFIGKLVLNAIVDVLRIGSGRNESNILIGVLLLQLMILLSGAILEQVNSFLSYLLGKRISLDINTKIIEKASTLDYWFFESPHFYDMLTRAKRESDGSPLNLLHRITSIVRGCVMLLSMGGLLILFSFPLFGAMLIVCIPLLLVRLKYGEKGYWLQFNRTEEQRMAKYVSNLMTERHYIPEILSFGLWGHLFKKWGTAAQKFLHQDIQFRLRLTCTQMSAIALITCSTVGATAYIVYVSINKQVPLTIGEVMMYSAAFAGALGGLRTLTDGVTGIYENSLFLHDLIEFTSLNPVEDVRQGGRPIPKTIKTIEFINVSFKYPSTEKYALKDINVTFRNSESMLIAGPNGAGKTTLVKLLIRLYEPTEGKILLNGVDIREFEIETLRKSIGIIFQEFIRYAFSAKENIGCGSVDDIENMDRVICAAKQARADQLIARLPNKYHTILSKLFKSGQELSLGEWQRICLARQFMKDAPVFVFDEPTASLDIETEAHFLNEIADLSKNKICILISHRIFRKNVADRIMVLDKGEIVEIGTYDDLIAQNGRFQQLWKLYHNLSDKEVSVL
ncbi:MAG: ABC transporter ATP-binding protein [Planctomycetota bacterium]|jgi:ATP-binding cassette subfamily B protein